MNKVVDLSFVTDGTLDRILARRNRREEGLRECFQHNLNNAHLSTDTALAHLGDMVRAGIDVSEEIELCRVEIAAFALMVDCYERAAKQRERNDGQA